MSLESELELKTLPWHILIYVHLSKSWLLTSDEFGLDYTSRDTIDSVYIERTKIIYKITHAYLTCFLNNKNGITW